MSGLYLLFDADLRIILGDDWGIVRQQKECYFLLPNDLKLHHWLDKEVILYKENK